jgi:hypothetical protein
MSVASSSTFILVLESESGVRSRRRLEPTAGADDLCVNLGDRHAVCVHPIRQQLSIVPS